ncbi:hypothetical protein AAVH_25716 [Aphelenchoides avenae]|nr:hypothetical protein AAVH_25716 [Aphelenchus avenae]
MLRYKRSSTQGIRVLDCHLDEDNIRRLVKTLLYFNISTIEFPWMPYFLQQRCNEPFKMLVKANEMMLQSIRNVPCLTDVPQQLLKEASQMSERLCYGDETLFSITNQFSDSLNLTIKTERINAELGIDALPDEIRQRVQHLRIKSAIRLCENNTERIIRGLSDVEPHLPNVNEVDVEMEHIISEEDYCFDTDKFADVEALCQRVIEEMAKVVNLVDTEFIWLPTVKKWNFTINFHFRTYSDYFDDEENNRDFMEMVSAKIMVVSWYFEKEEDAGPGTVKASFDVSSNKRLTAVFEMKQMTEFEPATCDCEDYDGYVKFHEDFSA